MITDIIRAAIEKRAATDDEWTYGVEQRCKEELEILSKNIEGYNSFS